MGELKRINLGERITSWPAKTWNQLVDGEMRDRARRPASPQPGQQQQPSTIVVLLTETVDAASWADGELTPTVFYAELMVRNAAGKRVRSGDLVQLENEFTTDVTVSAGMGKLAIANGGVLYNVDCHEVDLAG